MRVHAVAIDSGDGLGHEGGVESVALGNRLQRESQGDGVIGGA